MQDRFAEETVADRLRGRPLGGAKRGGSVYPRLLKLKSPQRRATAQRFDGRSDPKCHGQLSPDHCNIRVALEH